MRTSSVAGSTPLLPLRMGPLSLPVLTLPLFWSWTMGVLRPFSPYVALVVKYTPTPRRPSKSGVPNPGQVRTGERCRAGNMAGQNNTVAGKPMSVVCSKSVLALYGSANCVPARPSLVGSSDTFSA